MKKFKYICNKLFRKLKLNNSPELDQIEIPTIISSNCIGGMIYHDYGLQFKSPFINTYIDPKDFIVLCENLQSYMSFELVKKNTILKYPVGDLNGIEIGFPHVKTFEEAKRQWDNRKKRIDYNNIVILTLDRTGGIYPGEKISGLSNEYIDRFESLPFKYKIMFSSRSFPNDHSVRQIIRFREAECVGVLTDFYGWFGKRGWELDGGVTSLEVLKKEI